MLPLPFPLALLLLPLLTTASPSPALVSDAYIPLIPRNFLFLRQLSDLQTFASALGGVPASPITDSGDPKRPFSVDGDTFTDFESAAQRSCDNQFNKCGQAANGGGNKGGLTVGECDKQKGQCNDAQKSAQVKDFTSGVASVNIGESKEFPDFDLICDA